MALTKIPSSLLDTTLGLSLSGDITLVDNDKAIFGTGSDLQIYHNGNNSFITDTGTGNLYLRAANNLFVQGATDNDALATFQEDGFVKLYFNNAEKLATTSTGIDVTGVITTDGLTTSADINFGDNDKAIFGAGSDLQIYSDSNNSIINEVSSTGSLLIQGSHTRIKTANGVETMAEFIANGAVTLYYDNSAKLATTSTGIDVTGNIVVSGTVDGRDIATDGTKLDTIETNADVTDTTNVTAAGALMDSEIANLAQVKAFDSSDYATAAQGTTADSALQNIVEDTTPQLGGDLASNGNDILFADNDKAIFGAGSDLEIYHDSSNSYIVEKGTGNLRIQATNLRFKNASGGSDYLQATTGGALTIFYAGSSKLATSNTGIDVTGNIVVSGTVDGRDIATDGTKLDGIEANATADQTQSEINALGITATGLSGTPNITVGTISSGAITSTGAIQGASFSDGTISGITFIDEDSFATNSATRIPTQQSIKAYVDTQVAGVVDSAPAALDTLNELAAALGDDANFSTTTSTALGNRLRVDTAAQGLTGTQQANAITNLGITATKAELNFVDGVTSNIQTQLDGKQASGSYLTGNQTITLSGDVSGSGTTSIAVTIADDSHNHVISNVDGLQTALDAKLPLAGGSMTGQLVIDNSSANPLELKRSSQVGIEFNDTSVGSRYLGVNSGNLFFGGNLNHATNARVFHDTYHPNADTLTTARTISLTGAVTGSVSFNGSSNVSIATTATADPTLTLSGDASGSATFTNLGNATLSVTVADDSHNHVISNVDGLQTALDAKLASSSYTAADVLTKIKTVDGAGSGLDADLLDGVSSGSFLRSDADDAVTNTGVEISFYSNDVMENASGDQATLEVFQDTAGSDAFMQFHISGDYAAYFGLKGDINDFAVGGWSMGANYYRVWHAGNDGSGSGLDADLLDGLQLHTGRNNVANRVVRTDGSGYIQAGWINTTSGATSSTLTRIYCSQDGYIRYQTPANFGVSISPHINYNTIANRPTLGGGTPYLDLATGNYATVKVDDDRGVGWAGYAIRDDWVFMSDGAGTSGIYNDTDNEWAAIFRRNAETELFHNGALKMETTSSGISVTGNVVATGNVTAYSSDERLKTNITPIENPIEKVKQLNGVEFDWKDNVEELGFTPRVKHETGVIAQNVQSVIPDATPNAPFNEEYLTVQHEKIIPVLIEAIKEQQKQIDELKQALHEQKEIK
jgi:hypothetical protein